MYLKSFWVTLLIYEFTNTENIGWKSYLAENPIEFHDLTLQWLSGISTSVPNWLTGVFVRNGPAQVSYSF